MQVVHNMRCAHLRTGCLRVSLRRGRGSSSHAPIDVPRGPHGLRGALPCDTFSQRGAADGAAMLHGVESAWQGHKCRRALSSICRVSAGRVKRRLCLALPRLAETLCARRGLWWQLERLAIKGGLERPHHVFLGVRPANELALGLTKVLHTLRMRR